MLTEEQKAQLHATQTLTLPKRASIWRTPAPVGGKTGAPAQAAANVPCNIWPAAQNQKIVAVLPDLAGARYSDIGIFLDTTDVRAGDELRISGKSYQVLGVGMWSTLKAAGLSEVVTP